jgi:uncharacterized protein (TIGR00251 family)
MNSKPLTLEEKEGGTAFQVRVVPRARRNEIVGVYGGALKIKLAAPPVEGAANEALVKFLAERLGLRVNQIEIVTGHRARLKMVQVRGLSAEAALERLVG